MIDIRDSIQNSAATFPATPGLSIAAEEPHEIEPGNIAGDGVTLVETVEVRPLLDGGSPAQRTICFSIPVLGALAGVVLGSASLVPLIALWWWRGQWSAQVNEPSGSSRMSWGSLRALVRR